MTEIPRANSRPWFDWKHLFFVAVLVALFWRSSEEMYIVWTMKESLYSHGFLVPLISLFVAWTKRSELQRAPRDVSAWGFVWLIGGLLLLVLGDFLGFRVFGQASIIPILTGVIVLLFGKSVAKLLWFPLAFLIFMVPIPPSITAGAAQKMQLLAAELAVKLARLLTLPMVQDGVAVHFGNDHLVIGEVCAGLRSLISLLAVGALATYFSRTRPWARVVLVVMTVPIAIVANVLRIFLLCVVGYFWGSKFASGTFHDASGVLIFVVAFALFFALEAWLRRVAPQKVGSEPAREPKAPRVERADRASGGALVGALILLVVAMGCHIAIRRGQDKAANEAPKEFAFDIPAQIGQFTQDGPDLNTGERVLKQLENASVLQRRYRAHNKWPVILTVVYAGETRRSLHFPEVCFTGSGFEVLRSGSRQVSFLLDAKQLVLVRGEQRIAELYWFKTGDTLTGNYFLNAWYWAKSQLAFQSPSSSKVQLETVIPDEIPGGEEIAFQVLDEFAMSFTPILRKSIP